MCSPKLIGGRTELDLAELKKLPSCISEGGVISWKKWWDHLGVTGLNPMEGAQYDLFSMAIEAAWPVSASRLCHNYT